MKELFKPLSAFGQKTIVRDCLTVCFCMLAAYMVVWMFSGQWPWVDNNYNSYVLQTRAWLSGNLDLGQDYPHLELAIREGKYYVSFPPFPSIVYLPFAAIFGEYFRDGFISLAFAFMGGIYCVKTLHHFGIKGTKSVLWTITVTLSSNLLFVCITPWVWFVAQNMAFALSMMAIYYALAGKGGWSLFFWACAVGCRPFQVLYLPILLYILYSGMSQEGLKLWEMIKKRFWWCIGALAVAIVYMWLNYARFGSVAEFGHNYLPEFTRSEYGQFHISYLGKNLLSLIRLPEIGEHGELVFQQFDGTNMFIVSPIFIVWLGYSIAAFVKKEKCDKLLIAGILVMAAAELVFIALHKTMGGSHFGNRYTNDILPLSFLGIMLAHPKSHRLLYPVMVFGLALNIGGALSYYC